MIYYYYNFNVYALLEIIKCKEWMFENYWIKILINGGWKNMLRKKLSFIICTVFLLVSCVGLFACGNNDVGSENDNFTHDTTKWFTE